jgi:hypothetical protein
MFKKFVRKTKRLSSVDWFRSQYIDSFLVYGSLADVMPKAKKLLLLHEKRETWRVHIGEGRVAFCSRCAAETIWLTGNEAAHLADMSERRIFRLIENEKVHFQETKEGALLICSKSLEAITAG